METQLASAILKELGHPTRLSIYRQLVKVGKGGISVGELQKILGVAPSTLSHHISSLVAVDLVKQTRDGRTLFCTAQYETLNDLIFFLSAECCADKHLSNLNARLESE